MYWESNSIVFYSNFPFHVEDWAFPSVEKGIAGSEEAVIYLSQELVKLGYKVTIFNSCGEMEGEYNGVTYQSCEKLNINDDFNIFIFHRYWLQPMTMKLKAKKIAVWMHDNPQLFPPIESSHQSEFLESFDKLFMLSNFHKSLLPDWIPDEKIFMTRNGINLEDFNIKGINRNPKRLIYISDYTRGIEHLLTRWSEVLQEVPDAELHLFYGWQVIDALIKSPFGQRFPHLPDKKKELLQLFQQKNVYEHGRIGHKQLVEELLKSTIYVYPCNTMETFCISCLKAQASGCIPVVSDIAGLAENVKIGVKIKGIASSEEASDAFLKAVIDLLKNPDKQEPFRQEALALKDSFGWDKVAQQWHEEFILA